MRFKLWLCNLKHIRVKIKSGSSSFSPTNCLLPPCRHNSASPPPSSSFQAMRSPSGPLQRSLSSSSSYSYSRASTTKRSPPRQGFSIDCGCTRPLSSSRSKKSSKDSARGGSKGNNEQEITATATAARRSTNSIHDDRLSKPPVVKKKEQEGLTLSSLSRSSSTTVASWSRSAPPTAASTELMLSPACLDPTSAHAKKAWFPAPPIDQMKESNALLLHRMSSSSSLSSSSSGVTKHMNMNSNNGRKEHPSSSRTTSDQDSFFTSVDKGRSSNSSYSSSINDYHPSRRNANHHHHHRSSLSSSSSPSPSPLKKTAEAGLMKEQLMTEEDEIVHAKLLIKTYSTRRAAGPLEVGPAQYMSPARTIRSCCSSVSSFSRTLLQACTTEVFLKDERLIAGDSDDAGEVLYPWLCDDDQTESVVDLESTKKPWSDYDRIKRHSKTSSRKGINSNSASSTRRRRKYMVEPASTGYSSPLDTPHSVVSSVISSSASSYQRRQRAPANAFRQAAFRYYFGEVTPPSSPDRPLIDSSLKKSRRRRSSSSSKRTTMSATHVVAAEAPCSPPWSNEQHPVGDSVAIVKRSGDPYIDFRDSMVDMILEKRIYSSADMEGLLQCFLSLNSVEHHETIVRAFSEVWEVVFGNATRSPLIPCVP